MKTRRGFRRLHFFFLSFPFFYFRTHRARIRVYSTAIAAEMTKKKQKAKTCFHTKRLEPGAEKVNRFFPFSHRRLMMSPRAYYCSLLVPCTSLCIVYSLMVVVAFYLFSRISSVGVLKKKEKRSQPLALLYTSNVQSRAVSRLSVYDCLTAQQEPLI